MFSTKLRFRKKAAKQKNHLDGDFSSGSGRERPRSRLRFYLKKEKNLGW
jgi:hypothetical protein